MAKHQIARYVAIMVLFLNMNLNILGNKTSRLAETFYSRLVLDTLK